MKRSFKFFLFFILAVGVLLRLFKLQELFYFSMDEALIAFRGWGLFVLKRPFLIGGGSPLQVHLPPYFYYLSAFLLWPFNFNPLGWGVWAAIFSLLTIYLTFYLGRQIFSRPIGLIAALLYSFSFTAVFFDRHYWPLFFNPLLILLALFFLGRLGRNSIWPYLGLSLVVVFALTADPSNIPLVFTLIVLFWQNQQKFKLKFVKLSTLFGLSLFFLPLLAFDLRHQWQNLKGINQLFQKTLAHQTSLPKIIDSLLLLPRSLVRFWYSPQTNISQLYSYCIPEATVRQHALPWALVVIAIFILSWFIKRNLHSQKLLLRAISWLLIFYPAGIFLYALLGYSIFDHYLAGLLPIFALLSALVITRLPKLITCLLLLIFLVLNLTQIYHSHNPYGLAQKQALVTWAEQELAGQAFALDSISKCQRENGLRYLFEISPNPPVISFMDPYFFWLYREPPLLEMPDKILLVTDKPLFIDLPLISQQVFGALKAFILDNSSRTYKL